jgi:ribosomal protein L37E
MMSPELHCAAESMGSFNTLRTTVACPRCGAVGEVEIEMRFGDASNMLTLCLGERYPWRPRKQPQNGGRPDGGNTDGEGYMVCDRCGKDSFLRVVVRDDVIARVEPDAEKRGYVPD